MNAMTEDANPSIHSSVDASVMSFLPMVPSLHRVLQEPNVSFWLETLLGRNYFLHPHRHCHTNFPRVSATTPAMFQPFHKDGHAHKPRPRHREPRWIILFYNPQDTPLVRGPTAVVPGSHLVAQHNLDRRNVFKRAELERSGNALTLIEAGQRKRVEALSSAPGVTLCHFDLEHGGMTNGSVMPRYVHKFVFMRTERPTAHDRVMDAQDSITAHLCQWLGRPVRQSYELASFSDWQNDLVGNDPTMRSRAIYQSADMAKACRESAIIEALLEAVAKDITAYQYDEVLNIADAVNGLAQLDDRNPLVNLLDHHDSAYIANACYGLGQAREPIVIPRLIKLVDHVNPGVRRHAISALGIITGESPVDVSPVVAKLHAVIVNCHDWDVRLFAV